MKNLKKINLTIKVLIVITIYSFNAFANNEHDINSKSTNLIQNEDLTLFEQYVKEVQGLTDRVEILERKINALEQNNLKHQQSANNINEVKTSVDTNKTLDIFEVAIPENSTKEQNNNHAIVPIADKQNDKTQYELALAVLKSGKYSEAESEFANFLNDHPKSTLVSNAYFWYGETFFKRNMYDKATINYLKSYKQSAKGSKASDALLKLAIALSELKKSQEACGVLAKLEVEFPKRSASSIKRSKDLKNKLNCN